MQQTTDLNIITWCALGHLDKLQNLFYHNPPMNIHVIMNRSPICVAAKNGHTNIVSFLLDHGADANAASGVYSILYFICVNNHLDTMRFMMTIPGLLINKRILHGKTILHHAVTTSVDGMVEILLTYPGIDPNILDADHKSPICYAFIQSRYKLVDLLLPRVHLYSNYIHSFLYLSMVQTMYVLVCAKQIDRLSKNSCFISLLPMDVIRMLCTEFIFDYELHNFVD